MIDYTHKEPVNRILDSEQVFAVLEIIFINRPIKILKAIARTGRNACGVPWVHFENEISGRRMATFISFDDLLESFWTWLETASLMLMSTFKVNAIALVIWQWVQEGESVYHSEMGWVELIDKDITQGSGVPRFWVGFNDELVCLPAIKFTNFF